MIAVAAAAVAATAATLTGAEKSSQFFLLVSWKRNQELIFQGKIKLK